jgi:PAS domain S-box-containing protein
MEYREKSRDKLADECLKAKEALLRMEDEFSLLLDILPVVVFKGYEDGSVEFRGSRIESVTGYSRADFNSRKIRWPDLVFEEDFDHAKGIFIQALQTNRRYLREYRIKRRDGQIVWLEETGQIVCDADGRMQYVYGIMADITGRVITDRSSAGYIESLQEMLMKSSRELNRANKRLREAGLD